MNTSNARSHRRLAALSLALLLTLLTFFMCAPPARAADANPPSKMTFQGFLTDAANPPVPLGNTSPVNKEITFKIYDNATGGAVKWAETQIVTVDKGHFSVLLGEGAAVSGQAHPDLHTVFVGADASDRWIGITVDGAEITPRIQFFAAPYAQLARAANTLVNNSVLTILDNGRLGVGTTSPERTLHVNGPGAARFAFGANGFEILQSDPSNWQFLGIGSVTSLSFIGANVGIGTSSPLGALDVNGATGANSWTYFRGNTGTLPNSGFGSSLGGLALGWNRSGGEGENHILFSSAPGSAPALVLGSFNGSAINRVMTLKTDGNVGIGTTAPATLLEVGPGPHWRPLTVRGAGGTDAVVIGNLSGKATIAGHVAALNNVADLVLNPDGGNVGIGTSAPTYKLAVNGGIGIQNGNVLDLGVGKAGRETNAGKIGYEIFGAGALHIAGAGSAEPRNIRLWDRVGIGTSNPGVPLHVNANANIDTTLSYFFDGFGGVNHWGTGTGSNPHNGFYSAIFVSAIQAAGFYVISDGRIKQITRRSSGQNSLDALRQLQVTDYTYIDKLGSGPREHRGLIAQEVEKVLPQAVSQGTEFVPDIYARATDVQFDAANRTLAIELKDPHGLKVDDMVSLIMEHDGKQEATVSNVPTPTSFVVKAEKNPGRVFVFGKQVKDFRAVDYDHVFTTSISAIQELDRQVQALNKSEARIAELEQKTARMAELEQKAARVDTLEREMAELKKLVAGLAQGQTEPRPAARRIAATR